MNVTIFPSSFANSNVPPTLYSLTTVARLALTLSISNAGIIVYDTTANSPFVWNGTNWQNLSSNNSTANNNYSKHFLLMGA